MFEDFLSQEFGDQSNGQDAVNSSNITTTMIKQEADSLEFSNDFDIKFQFQPKPQTEPNSTIIQPAIETNRSNEVPSIVQPLAEESDNVEKSISRAVTLKKRRASMYRPQPECREKFTQNSLLTYHRRVHMNEKNNSIHCRICLHSFSSNVARSIHEDQCNKRRFECYLCHVTLQSRTALEKHLGIHTMMKSFKCSRSSSKRKLRPAKNLPAKKRRRRETYSIITIIDLTDD